jgi:hypothetical protein
MKKITLAYLSLLIVICTSAQTPQALNYQAIARNSTGQIIPAQNIGVRFTIQDATGGTIYYQETQTTTTNNFGLFTLAIGNGTVVSGSMTAIDWGTGGNKMLKVEIAPQGGTNYTMQGTTQLLSVPYALYAEKTKLIGGNTISITNGNTINANFQAGTGINITGNTISGNYLAGPGINITGNTISATAANNSWLLSGNGGTTAANFLGTTDNIPLRMRVNNAERFSISNVTPVGTYNVAYVNVGDPSPTSNNTTELNVNGKDISGTQLPFAVNTSVVGMTWNASGGSNNTLGRLMRMAQWTSASNNQFYDVGIDQEGDYFLSEHQLSGTGGIFPKKMLQITSTNNVGINMDWTDNPTANFHTKGTVRFEGINTDNTLARILVMDNNGNVASRDASTLSGGGFWTTDPNGIHNTNASGNVGIGVNSKNDTKLTVMGTGDYSGEFNSTLTWQTAVNIRNASNNRRYALVVGGTANNQPLEGVGAGFFGIANDNTTSLNTTYPLIITSDDKVGINMGVGGSTNVPTANLHAKGSVRFEGINTNNTLTRLMVMDNNGNVSARDANTLGSAGNAWSLTGNAGTTAANFLGTTDNLPLRIRVNNTERFSISNVSTVGSYNVAYVTAGDPSPTSNNTTQFSVNGKDISGSQLPFVVNASVAGMSWNVTGGSNNTIGRLLRMAQWTSASNNQFYDAGIDQEGDYYITEHQLSGTGGTFPKKMLQISSTNNVGINMDWTDNPTANFHTKGSLRFEGINTDNTMTRILVMDNNGNVSSRDASTLGSGTGFWTTDVNGIHNTNASGNVGVGTNSKADTKFIVMGTGDYSGEFNSTLTWQTAVNIRNASNNRRYALVVGGTANNQALEGVGAGFFGIANDNTTSLNTTYPIIISADDKVGVGMGVGGSSNAPKSQLHVKNGDIYIDSVTAGVIMKSPNGSCFRMTVSNAGTPVFTPIPCP